MTLLDVCFDHYQCLYCPNVLSMSFVDNYNLIASSAHALLRGYASMEAFTELWGLTLDRRKTYMCATSPSIRSQLRALHFEVKLTSMELGRALSFGKRSSASLQLVRLRSLDPAWKALKRLVVPESVKEILIRQAFWPRGLHAVCLTPLHPRHLVSQRTKAVRVLGHGRAGSHSGSIRLWLLSSTPETDPFCYQLIRSFMDFRRLIGPLLCKIGHYQGSIRLVLQHCERVFFSLVKQLANLTF